jgi:hypothetical protein
MFLHTIKKNEKEKPHSWLLISCTITVASMTQKDIDVQKHLIGRCLLMFTIKELNNTHLTNGSFDFLLRLYIKGICFKEGLQHKPDRI